MWVLESFSHVVVAGPFKSQAEMARKLGLSQQFVNRQIQKCKFRFRLDGQDVIAHREKEFVGGGKRGSDKEELAMRLGVSQEAVDKVLRKNRSGFIQTPQGKVKIQKLKPGEKPPLPAVRVLWNEDTEKQDFVSFAAAAKELKIHPKTIASAIKAGRDSFTRKSDGKKFTFEIPKENTPSRKKPKPLSEEEKANRAEAARQRAIKSEVIKFYNERVSWNNRASYKDQVEHLEKFWPGVMADIRRKVGSEEKPPAKKEPGSSQEEKPPAKKEPGSSQEEKPQSSQPSAPPISRPISVPKKKVSFAASTFPVEPPVQSPRKKVPIAASAFSPPEARFPPAQPPAPTGPLGGRTVPVMGHLHEILKEKLEEKQRQLTDARRFQKPGLSKLEKEIEELKLQEGLYHALRVKYAGWFLDDTVGSGDETQTVLYNPTTGEDFLVEEDEYELLAQFFLSRGYVDFLSNSDFLENWRYGKLQFPAQKSSELQEENWMLLNFIKDP